MKVVGVTGGIGMGKSTCGDLLRRLGVQVVDTDDIARELVTPGQPALRQIQEAFGQNTVGAGGSLDRRTLAKLVFASEENRRKLEGILHPPIRDKWRQVVSTWQTEGHLMAAVIIPLLFETGAEKELDAVICVACSRETQLARLANRGWSTEHLAQRESAQLPVSTKMERSNYVVWTEGSIPLLEAQLRKILGHASAMQFQ